MRTRRRLLTPYLLIAPAIILLVLLSVFPVGWSLVVSLKRMTLLDLMTDGARWVGTANYGAMLADGLFWDSVTKSAVFVGISVAGQIGIGLALAMALNQPGIKGRGVFRAVFLVPWITTNVIIAYAWIYLLDPQLGLLPSLSFRWDWVAVSGLGRKDWFTNPRLVIVTLAAINTWEGTAFSMLLQSAGLQSISPALLESAEMDGAKGIRKHYYITLPLLSPFLLVNAVLATMLTFNVYDTLLLITGGGPAHASEVLSLLVYNTGFVQGRLGYAAALSTTLLLINVTVTVVYLRLIRTTEFS